MGDCWVLASVNGKRKEKISKVRELLWRENEKTFAKCKWKVISYEFAGNGNIPKSCYSFQKVVTFRKVVTFQKVVIFLIDTIFQKIVIFSKRHNFLDKMCLNRFHWTDTFLTENGYKRKSIFNFLKHWKNFPSLHLFFSQIKSKCRSTEFVWLVAVLQFVEVKEVWGTAISLTGLIRFISREINP